MKLSERLRNDATASGAVAVADVMREAADLLDAAEASFAALLAEDSNYKMGEFGSRLRICRATLSRLRGVSHETV